MNSILLMLLGSLFSIILLFGKNRRPSNWDFIWPPALTAFIFTFISAQGVLMTIFMAGLMLAGSTAITTLSLYTLWSIANSNGLNGGKLQKLKRTSPASVHSERLLRKNTKGLF